MTNRAKELIEVFQLSKHPEGGYFREVYRSDKKCFITQNGYARCWLTDIYFLLTKDSFSRFHRLTHDEVWHFYEGAPVTLTEIHPQSFGLSTMTIGQPGPSINYKHCVQANVWQSAVSRGAYSLLGCTVAPGFEFDDFEMMDHNKEVKAAVLSKYPELGRYI